MEKNITILDREKLSSNYINSKQDFGKVLSGHQKIKPPLWKKPVFFGTIGIASVALVLSVVNISSLPSSTDEISPNQNEILAANFSKPLHSNSEMNRNNSNTELVAVVSEEKTEEIVVATRVETEKSTEKETEIITVIEDDTPLVVEVSPSEEVETLKRKSISFPSISGVFNGDISVSDLCSKKGIECVDNSYGVTSYSIEYFNGRETVIADVRGYKIPASVCETINSNSAYNQIFITNIKAEHRATGRKITLNSLSLNPVY